MTGNDDIRIHPTPTDAASHVGADVVTLLAGLLDAGQEPRIVLTGGSIARDVHRDLAARSQGLDWSHVTVLWGDERFLPAGDDERNDAQADEDLLAYLPVNPARVLRAPSTDEAPDVESAAATYAGTISQVLSHDDAQTPAFDLLMLGIGPDGHVASLFPDRGHSTEAVLAVHDSPKPPPERVSMGYDLLARARRVWFVAAGDDKAEAVAASVRQQPRDLPAARVRGLEETRWYLDTAAASGLDA